MKRIAAWLGFHALVGVLAAVGSSLGRALVSDWNQPLADLAAATSTAATRSEGWAALWLDQLPATLIGCSALALLTALTFRAGRAALGIDVVMGAGGVAFGTTMFALFNVPAPGAPLTVYSYLFVLSGQAALFLLELMPRSVGGAAFSLFAPLWPLVVLGALTSSGVAFGIVAGAGLERLVLEGGRVSSRLRAG